MIKTVDEFKEFITWAKSQKLKSARLDNVEFEFSDLGLIEGLPDLSTDTPKDLSTLPSSARLPDASPEATEESEFEKDLFWSTKS
jgi:hypothetical protein